MEKNWLIRTKEMQLLGPVAKEKVIEFIGNGTLKEEDELCSGNGYWFWVKEGNLVEKYLKGNAQQSFDPLGEAKDTYLNPENNAANEPEEKNTPNEAQDNNGESTQKIPNEDDLEFPDMD